MPSVLSNETSNNEAPEEHREQEVGYELLVEQSTEVICIHQEGRIVYINPAGADLLAVDDPKEMVGRSVLDFVHPDYHKIVKRRIREGYTKGKKAERTEEKFIRADGEIIDVEVTGIPISYRGRPAVQTMARDITDRKQMEKALLTSERKYRKLFESANDALIIFEPDEEIILEVNEKTCKMYGFDRSELIGMSLKRLSQDVRRGEKEIHRTLQNNQTQNFETTHFHKDGTAIHQLVNASVIEFEGQKAILSINHDITKQKQFERELIAAKEAAEEMSRLKATFLANMSHEIRTPLTSILGFADVLATEISGDYKEMVQLIQQAGRRLQATLSSVLDLAQLEADSFKLSLEPLDVCLQIQKLAQLFRLETEQKCLQFNLNLPEENITVLLDEAALARILNNLVNNALKFTSEGSISIEVEANITHVRIHVIDTGIGISKTFLPHLFDEFKQESEGLTRSHEGSGLGLAISRQLVELMDGTLEAESKKGEGTTFTITFPRHNS